MRFWNCNLIVVTGRFIIVVRYSGQNFTFWSNYEAILFSKKRD